LPDTLHGEPLALGAAIRSREMLGGIISSTNVTLSFARTSRKETNTSLPLAFGVIGASAVMCVWVLVATAVLNLPLAVALMPYLAGPFVVASLINRVRNAQAAEWGFGGDGIREFSAICSDPANGGAAPVRQRIHNLCTFLESIQEK
jgi:hypothetical protein